MAACSTSLGLTDDCMLVNVKPRVLRRSFSNASTSFSIIYSTFTTGQIDDDAVCPESIPVIFGEKKASLQRKSLGTGSAGCRDTDVTVCPETDAQSCNITADEIFCFAGASTSFSQDTRWHKPASGELCGYLYGQQECRTAGRGRQGIKRTR